MCLERGADCLHMVQHNTDNTAIPKPRHLLFHLNPDRFYLSDTAYPGFPGKQAIKQL